MPVSRDYDVLLKLLSNSIFKTNFDFEEDTPWKEVIKESIAQSVTAIAFDGAKNAALPNELSEQWLLYSASAIRNNHFINRHHSVLHKLMTENGIPYCVLKGTASEYYYPDPNLRCMGDVDFYVPHEYFKKAIDVFLSNGFVTRGEKEDVHTVFRKGKMHFEMHFEPPGIPSNKMRGTIEKYFENILEESNQVQIGSESFVIPGKFHHGLILILHTCHHLLREGVGLRHLCDWAVFINSLKKGEFEKIFEEKLKRIGMWNFACILTITAGRYLNLPLSQAVSTDFNKFDELIGDIFISGNFGKKDQNRYFESLYISSQDTMEKSKNKVGQFITSINNIIFSKHKWLKKLIFLIPFFWLFYGIRYFIRYLFGKRRAILSKEIIESSSKRKNIYNDFHLFETEN